MTEQLEAVFHEAMVDIYHTAASLGYRPTYFLRMVSEHGGVSAARRLLRAAERQSGLTRLRELDRLDISVEALVLQERWKVLFSDKERRQARERLRDYGYDPFEAEFHEAMVNIYHAAASLGYRPTYFLRMVSEHGGVTAAKRLLRTTEHQSGLTRLYELGRLDISAEALVLQERWKVLFSNEERRQARERLRDYGYDPFMTNED